MINYKLSKKIRNVKDAIINVLLFPLRIIFIPYFKYKDKNPDKIKKMSKKKIDKLVKYCMDYHLDKDSEFYVSFARTLYEDARFDNLYNYRSIVNDMSWGWSGENKKVKNSISKLIYVNLQEHDWINCIEKYCRINGRLMNEDEKIEFARKSKNNYYNDVKNIVECDMYSIGSWEEERNEN